LPSSPSPAAEPGWPTGPLYAAVAGWTAAAVGALVLIAWALDFHSLKTLVPAAAAMKPNTAVGLLLLGVSLVCVSARAPPHVPSRKRVLLARICATVPLLIGALTLGEYITGESFGVDRILFPNAVLELDVPYPGRISQATSTCLILLSLSVMLLDSGSRTLGRLAQWPALGATALGFIAVLGYLYGAEQLYRIRPYTSVAVHTALTIVALGLALVLVRPDRSLAAELFSKHHGGLAARRLLPIAIVVPVIAGWLRLQGQRAGWYDTEIGLALFAAANVITFTTVIWLAARSLNRVDADRRGSDFRRLQVVREAETRWRALVEASAQIVWTAGPNGEVQDSPSLRAFTGQTPEQFQVDAMTKVVHPEDAERMRLLWQKAVATRTPFESEFRLLHSSREWRWVSVRGVPIEPTADSNIAWVGMNYDITARKQAESLASGQKNVLELIARGAPLEETLTTLARIAEAQSEGMLCSILLLDAEGKHLRHSAAPSLPREYTAAIDGVEIGAAVGSCGTAAFTRRAVYVEDIAVDPLWKDYKHVALPHGLRACWSTPIIGANQQVLGTFAIYYREPGMPSERHLRLVDLATHTATIAISRHNQMQALRDSESRFRQLAETLPQLVWTCGPDGQCDYLSQQWAEFTGRPTVEQLGRGWTAQIHPDDREAVSQAWRTSSQNGTPLRLEFRLRRFDGAYRWFDTRAVPLRDETGAVVKWVGSNTDIDERKRFEETRLRSQKLESLGTLAGGIAHDFNNMLLVIQGNAQLAQDLTSKTDPVQENLLEISQAGERATDLVRRILSFSRPQKARHKVIEIAPVVEEALRLTRAALPAMVEIRTRLALQVPPVSADATQIHQVVVNLVTNAAHALGTRAGGLIEIDLATVAIGPAEAIGALAKLPHGQYARLTVRDNGCGISSGHLDRIFDPFFTTKPVGQGTGLGLSIVHGIMHSSGGTVTVQSEVGKGTTFHLYFPAAEKIEAAAETALPPGHPRGNGQHILFIDDEDSIVRLGTLNLTRLGYRVTGCTSPVAALKEFRRDPAAFDAVVSDLSMPGLSGFDCAREMLAVRPDLPILLTSGYMRPEDEEQAREIGIRAVSGKPTALGDLGRTLSEILAPPPLTSSSAAP
jgi:PAS domain S-box-containing protein